MRSLARGLAVLITVLAVHLFMFWVGRVMLVAFAIPVGVTAVATLLVAIAAAAYVWRATGPGARGSGSYVLSGALLVGAVGFLGGFFGPLIFDRGGNQGPLLGIILTGPAGLVLGGIAGGLFWHVRHRVSPDAARQ